MSIDNSGGKFTVDSLINNPSVVARRLAALSEQGALLAAAFSRPELSAWQRRKNRAHGTVNRAREALAVKLAPWLDR